MKDLIEQIGKFIEEIDRKFFTPQKIEEPISIIGYVGFENRYGGYLTGDGLVAERQPPLAGIEVKIDLYDFKINHFDRLNIQDVAVDIIKAKKIDKYVLKDATYLDHEITGDRVTTITLWVQDITHHVVKPEQTMFTA